MDNIAIKLKDKAGKSVYPCPYYPIGSIYLSINSTNPSTFFGGTWEQIKDTFLLACGSNFKAGSTGGEKEHTLSVAEMPSHRHSQQVTLDTSSSAGNIRATVVGGGSIWSEYDSNQIKNKGGSQPHNNMPPYLAVYAFKRIS